MEILAVLLLILFFIGLLIALFKFVWGALHLTLSTLIYWFPLISFSGIGYFLLQKSEDSLATNVFVAGLVVQLCWCFWKPQYEITDRLWFNGLDILDSLDKLGPR